MRHLQQPKGSRLCGQTCVAIVTHRSLTWAIDACQRGRSVTSEHDLRAGLSMAGLFLEDFTRVAERAPWVPPFQAFVRIRYDGRPHGYHWVVTNGQRVFDPSHRKPFTREAYARHLRRVRGYVTSWAEVWR